MTKKDAATPKSEVKVDDEAIEMYILTLPPYDMKVKDIAEKYGQHTVTVSKKVNAAKRKLEPAMKAQQAQMEKMLDERIKALVPVQGSNHALEQQGNTAIPAGAITIPTHNAFDALNSFADIARPSVNAGAVAGSAFVLLQESVNEEHPFEKRLEYGMKGGASLVGTILGAMETFKKINENKGGQH